MDKKPIRVLQVIGIMNRGGAETMIMNLYRNVDRTKVQFDFVEHTTEEAAFDQEILSMGGRIFRCPKYNVKNHVQYRTWWKQFFAEHAKEFTVVHGHIGSTAAIYLNVARENGLFTIAHSHNTNGKLNIKSLVYRCISFPTRYVADYFFGCSIEAGVDRFGKKKVVDDKTFCVLKNAIDVDLYKFDKNIREKVRESLGVKGEKVVGIVARFEIQKNHYFAINVFEKIVKQDNNVRLLLVGDGSLRDDIYKLVENKKLLDKVIFTGVRSDVSELLQAMDVFLFPSLYEGLGIAIVEAQAAGLPCIISDKIPKECIVTDLVSQKSLGADVSEWTKIVLESFERVRSDRVSLVRKNGYDINKTAKWLEAFYIEHSR